MRRTVVLFYVLAALLDDFYTFYMVGIRKLLVELNPINQIVETSPWAYLLFQALKEPFCLLIMLLISLLFYNSFHIINRRVAAIGSRLIVLSGVLARWIPVFWNLWVLGRFLA